MYPSLGLQQLYLRLGLRLGLRLERLEQLEQLERREVALIAQRRE
jgi:hypothetical protein